MHTPAPGAFDDDRLLALALGLDDDPELEEATAGDAALAGRLAAIRDDVAAVEAQVVAAVPPPGEAYVDLSDARWAGMRPYLQPSSKARARTQWSRRLRVVVPVAALAVLAFAVGLTAVYRSGDMATDNAGEVAESVPQVGGAGATTPTFAEQLDRFTLVILATAKDATGALQRFAVVRVLKGETPSVKVVELDVGDRPATPGRLHLLMLRPVALADAEALAAETEGRAPTKGADDGPGRMVPASYSYHGELALARELPSGADPETVTLP
jgi:hypothetical protein